MGKVREEFEEWVIKHHFSVTKKPDGKSYVHDSTMCAFEGWKASRVALYVELPENCKGMALTVDEFHRQLDKVGVSYK